MLDRETRREKILSALNKENALRNKARSKMRLVMDSGMLKRAGDTEVLTINISKSSCGFEEEKFGLHLLLIQAEDPCAVAEQKFFSSLKAQKEERQRNGKPVVFTDDE